MIGTIILLIAAIAVIGMAKRRRQRRRWGPDMFRVRLLTVPILGTLANATMLIASLTVASDNEYRALSIRCTWALRGLTAGEGTIHIGVAHGDYTAVEVEEWFENTTSISRGDKIANEKNDRLCRMIGSFSGVGTDEILNDGKPMTAKLNWVIPEGKTLNVWVYNQSGAPLTTGANTPVMGWLTGRYI